MQTKCSFTLRSRCAMRGVVAAAAMLALTAAAQAVEIHYTHTGSGSGSLNGVAFGAAAPVAFTITAIGDTANIASCGGGCLYNDNLSASITIDGLGSFDFVTGTRYFYNSGVGLVGFSRAGVGGFDLFNGPHVVAWDMASSIGPIGGTGDLLQWGPSDEVVNTSGGVLQFANGTSDSTFSAAVVPEPSAAMLLVAGLLGMGAWRRFGARQAA